jgi:hypothetical protein
VGEVLVTRGGADGASEVVVTAHPGFHPYGAHFPKRDSSSIRGDDRVDRRFTVRHAATGSIVCGLDG